jgi:excisionase family DNA binding protein
VTAPLLTIKLAADRLGVSRGYVYALIKRGELAHVELPSAGGRRAGRLMIDSKDLESTIAAWKTGGDVVAPRVSRLDGAR